LECPGCENITNDPEAWWNEASELTQGLIIGSIVAFFMGIVLAIRQLITSTNSSYETVALTQEQEDSEQIWDKKAQPPAYVEQEEEEQEEEKKPFLPA
jgi:flagellar biosynthesis/type III secretory pathway M-ring protein FliF/YscJ